MQDVGMVASQSPPNVMTSTKPVAQAALAPGQAPFDLVLQKTSERFDTGKNKDVHKGSEQRTCEKSENTSSSTNRSVSETREQKEVKKSNDIEKEEKTESKDKPESSDDSQTIPVNQYENSVIPQQPMIQPVETNDGDLIGEGAIAALSVLEAENSATTIKINLELPVESTYNNKINLVSVEQPGSNSTQPEMDLPESTLQTTVQTPLKSTSQILSDPASLATGQTLPQAEISSSSQTIASSETPNPTNLVKDQNTETESNSTKNKIAKENLHANLKIDTNDLKHAQTVTKIQGNETTIEPKGRENLNNIAETIADTAPPDIPKVAEGTASTSTVTTSQLNEPARLAEAPKNEVISQISTQIDQMVKTNRSTLRLQLYPEELGHIEIRITTTKSGIGVSMIADSASTQEVLKSEMNSLKQNMQQAGIQLSDLNIGQGQNSNKQQAFDENQQFEKSAYQSSKNSKTIPFENEKQVQLQTSAIDYRI